MESVYEFIANTAILGKLGVHSRLEAVAYAAKHAIICLGGCVLAALA